MRKFSSLFMCLALLVSMTINILPAGAMSASFLHGDVYEGDTQNQHELGQLYPIQIQEDTLGFSQKQKDLSSTQVAFGIDVSHHQGTIDWNRVKSQIDFAIIRCGYGDDLTNQDDRQWINNVQACTRLQIPFGVYIYSYALTDAEALSEAEHVLRLVKGYNLSLPIYLDLEDESILNSCSKDDILRHTKIFCETIENAGYSVGVYANYNWWTNYLTSSEYDQWDRWFARYASSPGYSKDFTIWQYSSTGSINGISGNVDLNYWYGKFPPENHEHKYSSYISQEPSCEQSGIRTYTCSCGDTYTEFVSAIGHNYQTAVLQPSCTEEGFTVYRCSVCCTSYQENVQNALGHDYSNGVCIRCGEDDPLSDKGDLNQDRVITSADSVMLARYLADLITLSDEQLLSADVNEDGIVTSADSVILARYLAGLIEFY